MSERSCSPVNLPRKDSGIQLASKSNHRSLLDLPKELMVGIVKEVAISEGLYGALRLKQVHSKFRFQVPRAIADMNLLETSHKAYDIPHNFLEDYLVLRVLSLNNEDNSFTHFIKDISELLEPSKNYEARPKTPLRDQRITMDHWIVAEAWPLFEIISLPNSEQLARIQDPLKANSCNYAANVKDICKELVRGIRSKMLLKLLAKGSRLGGQSYWHLHVTMNLPFTKNMRSGDVSALENSGVEILAKAYLTCRIANERNDREVYNNAWRWAVDQSGQAGIVAVLTRLLEPFSPSMVLSALAQKSHPFLGAEYKCPELELVDDEFDSTEGIWTTKEEYDFKVHERTLQVASCLCVLTGGLCESCKTAQKD